MSKSKASKSNRTQARETATKFNAEYCKLARKMCEMGATNTELAEQFGISTSEIRQWQVSHREFFEACKIGRALANERVERALFEHAVGHKRVVTKLAQCRGESVIVKYEEHAPAEMDAAKFWLSSDPEGRWVRNSKNRALDEREIKKSEQRTMEKYFKQFDGTAMRPKEQ